MNPPQQGDSTARSGIWARGAERDEESRRRGKQSLGGEGPIRGRSPASAGHRIGAGAEGSRLNVPGEFRPTRRARPVSRGESSQTNSLVAGIPRRTQSLGRASGGARQGRREKYGLSW